MEQASPPVHNPFALESYVYDLPKEKIAQEPLSERDTSQMLVVDPQRGLVDAHFYDLPTYLHPHDVVVVNSVAVRRARLLVRLDSGKEGEVLVTGQDADGSYLALVRPSREIPPGAQVTLSDGTRLVVGAVRGDGTREVSCPDATMEELCSRLGGVPLPPYIHSMAGSARYHTIYEKGAPHASAAPTAGFHMTDRVREGLRGCGVEWAEIRLDVGLGTFAPIRVDDIRQHDMHSEHIVIPQETCDAVATARARGGRVIAVGTTVVRALESAASAEGGIVAGEVDSDLFISPGYQMRVVDGLVTNFHQPSSSLLVLLATFMGDTWKVAYDHALASTYRFLSFGDCMLCWREGG